MKFINSVSKIQFKGYEPLKRTKNFSIETENKLFEMILRHAAEV